MSKTLIVQAKVREAGDRYVIEKLGASQRQADRLANYVISIGQYPISDRLTDIWAQQILWL